jgi:hypothetical protein
MAVTSIRPADKMLLENGRLKLEWDAYFARLESLIATLGIYRDGYAVVIDPPDSFGGDAVRVVGTTAAAGYHTALAFLPASSGVRLGFLLFSAFPNGFPDVASVHNSAAITAFSEGAWSEGTSYPTNIRFETTASGSTSRIERARIGAEGRPYFQGATTTASAANAHINTGSSPANELMISVSGKRYKRDIEDIDPARADAILELQPIWYRSNCEADNPEWSWYGLLAEDVAKIDPRLVIWGHAPDDYELVTTESGSEWVLKPDAKLVPNGVAYDRLGVLLLSVAKRQKKQIEDLEQRIASIEQRINLQSGSAQSH